MSALRDDLDRIIVKKLCQLSRACSDLYRGDSVMAGLSGRRQHRPQLFLPVLVTWQFVPVWEPLMRFIDAACTQHRLFEEVPHLPMVSHS